MMGFRNRAFTVLVSLIRTVRAVHHGRFLPVPQPAAPPVTVLPTEIHTEIHTASTTENKEYVA